MVTHWRVDPYAHTSWGNSITALVNGNGPVERSGLRNPHPRDDCRDWPGRLYASF
jgi:hypothetical protein